MKIPKMKARFLRLAVFVLSVFIVFSFIADAQTEMKVLFLGNNTSQAEFPVVSTITEIEQFTFEYTLTQDKELTQANPQDFDILWLGQGEICENGYRFTDAGEEAVLAFAEGGGVVINVEQDSDDAVGCSTGWLPEQLNGIETGGTDHFEPTEDAGDIFTFPEEVEVVHTNDKWHNPSPEFNILATDGSGHIIIATLPHGDGLYIVTGLQNENQGQAEMNRKIMTNILFHAAEHRENINAAVEPNEKVSLTWGTIKTEL